MRENPSYVFFQELTGPGPLGALGRPVTPHATVAADPEFMPLGAPVLLLDMDNPRAERPVGRAGYRRRDQGRRTASTPSGARATEAAAIAGGMLARGRAWLLLPRGTLARIRSRAAPAQR